MSLNSKFDIQMTGWDLVNFAQRHPEAAKELVEKAAQDTRQVLAQAKGFKHGMKSLFNWDGYDKKIETAKFLNEAAIKSELWSASIPKVGAEVSRQPDLPRQSPTALEQAYGQAPALRQRREVELTHGDRNLIAAAAEVEKRLLPLIKEHADNEIAYKHFNGAISSAMAVQNPKLSWVNREATWAEMRHQIGEASAAIGKGIDMSEPFNVADPAIRSDLKKQIKENWAVRMPEKDGLPKEMNWGPGPGTPSIGDTVKQQFAKKWPEKTKGVGIGI